MFHKYMNSLVRQIVFYDWRIYEKLDHTTLCAHVSHRVVLNNCDGACHTHTKISMSKFMFMHPINVCVCVCANDFKRCFGKFNFSKSSMCRSQKFPKQKWEIY